MDHPPGFEDLSGDACLGYAHGAAGIGDALLNLFLATGDERFLGSLTICRSLATDKGYPPFRWRIRQPTLDAPADPPAGAFWCHGAAGIGRSFSTWLQLKCFKARSTLQGRRREPYRRRGRRVGPTQCHGIAGNIEFLLIKYLTIAVF